MRISVMVFNDFSIIKVLSKMLISLSKKWHSASYLECIPTKRFLLPLSYVLRGSRGTNIFSWNPRSQKWPKILQKGVCYMLLESCQRCQTLIWLIKSSVLPFFFLLSSGIRTYPNLLPQLNVWLYTKEALNVVSTLCLDEDEVDP